MTVKIKKEITQNPVFLIMGDVGYLWSIANGYLKSIKELSKNYENFYAIELLSTTATELFLKVIIASDVCLKNKKAGSCIKKLIDDKFRNLGHRIDDLFNSNIEVMNKMDIDYIKVENSNGYINEYRIFFKDGKYVFLKNLESIRYGAFASTPNLMNGFNNPNLIDFLESLSMIAFEEKREKFNKLK